MANLAITNSFSAGTTIASAQVNQNYTDVKTWLNNRDNATDFWLNMKVAGTASNPGEIKSSSTDCEFDVDCTGSNGTPRYSLKRSGTTYFTWGVDGAASNLFKFGTTALTTNVAFQIPTTGVQVQFSGGSAGTPSVSTIGNTNTGMYFPSSNLLAFSTGGTLAFEITGAQRCLFVDGSLANPSVSFINAGAYGLSYNSSGSASVTLNANGTSGGYLSCIGNGDVLTTQLAPLATNATAGFFFLPTVGGTPTGTPSSYTGNAACLVDTTGSKFWVRIGASWKSAVLS